MELVGAKCPWPWPTMWVAFDHGSLPSFYTQGIGYQRMSIPGNNANELHVSRAFHERRIGTKTNLLGRQDSWTCISQPCSCDHQIGAHRCTSRNHDSDGNSVVHRPGKIRNRGSDMDLHHLTSIDCKCYNGNLQIVFCMRCRNCWIEKKLQRVW